MADKPAALFQELAGKGLITGQGELPIDIDYTPPQGAIIEGGSARAANRELLIYEPSAPTSQTDLLQDVERQYVLPWVIQLSMILRVPPITDDVYRLASDEMKDSSLFTIISRSQVLKVAGDYLHWFPFIAVIKRKIVLRVGCLYHPQKRDFRVAEVWMWQNNTGSYYTIQNPRLTPLLLPGLVDRWVVGEGIFAKVV
jgi:hypothetical protein